MSNDIEDLCRPFLLNVAQKVAYLLGSQENRKVFEWYAEQLLIEWKKYKSLIPHKCAKIIIKLQQKSLKNKRLQDEKAGPPKPGYIWYGPRSTGGFWIHPDKRIKTFVSPKFRIRFSSRDKLPADPRKRLEIFFLWLISIHDRMRSNGIYLILKDDHPELLAELNLCVDYVLQGGHPVYVRFDNSGRVLIDERGKELIGLALGEVETYLASLKPAETKQNVSPAEGGKTNSWYWILYEKTLKVVIDAILEKYGANTDKT